MFQIGDKIVHPMHGAGIIDGVVSRQISGVTRDYYTLKLSVGGMTLMIPTENSAEIGVRPVVEPETIDSVLQALPELQVEEDSNWNRRYRENMLRLKSGDLLEVARVMKGLLRRESEKGLSTGERKLLHTVRQIFASEIALSEECSYEDAEGRIGAALGQ